MNRSPRCEHWLTFPELLWELCPTGRAQGMCSTAGLKLPRKCPPLPSSSRCWELTTLIQISTQLPSGSPKTRPVLFPLVPFPGEKEALGGNRSWGGLSLADTCSALGVGQTCTYFTLLFTRSRSPQRPAQPWAAGACQHTENVNNPAGKSPPALPIPAPADAPAWLSSADFHMNPALWGVWAVGFYLHLPAAPQGVRGAPGAPELCHEISTGWAISSPSPPWHSPGKLCPFIHPVDKAMRRRGTAEGQPHRAEHQLSAG